jgi:penicillin-binding protein 1A
VIENHKNEKQVFKPETSRIMNQLLMGVTESGTAKSISLKEKINLAGKTGTSSGNKDRLFVGYTPYYTAGIWCGYDNGASGEALTKSHLSIWNEVMTDIHSEILQREEIESFSTEGLLYLPYCKDSGQIFCDNCIYDVRGNREEFGYFTEANRPRENCKRHVVCLYDSQTKAIACESCPPENLVKVSLISVNDRAFPKEITVTDAEFVYRDVGRYERRPIDYSVPYFEYTIPDGVFVGKGKGKKQFNSNCYIHSD